MSITGRQQETKLFKILLESPRAELVAVYGRRRVGKTFLIREFFKNQGIYFELTGIKDGTLEEQLLIFKEGFQKTFYPNIPVETPKSWREAFLLLTREIERQTQKKMIVFLDELPWLSTPRSGLMQQLDHFWNTDWMRQNHLILILCGSAASWILDNLVHAKGGLHNRLTQNIRLMPFNLRETRDYLVANGISGHNKQVLDLFMVMGGIPYYLNQVKKGLSATVNINDICFKREGLLYSEFSNVFASLFGRSPLYQKIIFQLARHHYGLKREELFKSVGLKTGGTAQKRFDELEEAGFISRFVPYAKQQDVFYRITDEYSLCYARWIHPLTKGVMTSENYWLQKSATSEWLSWAGYAFENVCFKHLTQIAKAIRADHTAYLAGNWREFSRHPQKDQGAQIDLLFDRDDGVINLCEIKYSKNEYVMTKAFAESCKNKIRLFKEKTKTKKEILYTMITTLGVKDNIYKKDLIASEARLNDLFG